jgi:hypothetical protein
MQFVCIVECDWLLFYVKINQKVVTKGVQDERMHHLENGKSYMSHLQQYTKIIKIPTLQTYFSKIDAYDVSHDIASSEKWCQCLDKKVQDFSVVKQNSNMRISK